MERDALGLALTERIGSLLDVAPANLRLISSGKVIKPDIPLQDQKIKPGTSVMVVVVDRDTNSSQVLEKQRRLLEDTKRDAQILADIDEDEDANTLDITGLCSSSLYDHARIELVFKPPHLNKVTSQV